MRAERRRSLAFLVAAVGLALAAPPARAGGFVFAGDANGLDVVTHPPNYFGTGGVVTVSVCVDPAAANAAAMEVPVQNIVTEINAFMASSPNLLFGGDNDIPPGWFDFESLTLHEFGHCLGLAHPNMGFVPGVVEGANTDYTKATTGPNGSYNFDDGVDNVIGSSDDLRSDDANLTWFFKSSNNPFTMGGTVDASTYSRDLADLPGGHTYSANASRDVGALLGVTDTEAVMQQGQGSDEDQRRMANDDVATFRFAMAGIDEIEGTADDYTMQLVYAGLTDSCDIVATSSSSGFASCSFGGSFIDGGPHVRITNGTFRYNASGYNWYFNPVLRDTCTAPEDDILLPNETENGTETYVACDTITAGPYVVGATGDVTFLAGGKVILRDGFEVFGTFAAGNQLP